VTLPEMFRGMREIEEAGGRRLSILLRSRERYATEIRFRVSLRQYFYVVSDVRDAPPWREKGEGCLSVRVAG
jgi:hypothetical protein